MERIEVARIDKIVAGLVYRRRNPMVRLLLRLFGVDVAPGATVEPGLLLPHATTGLVVHPNAVIGRDVTLFHNVTIGRGDVWRRAHPDTKITVGDRVIVGAGAVILVRAGQQVTIGDGAVIGANAVVTGDVGAGETWAGNPARKVR